MYEKDSSKEIPVSTRKYREAKQNTSSEETNSDNITQEFTAHSDSAWQPLDATVNSECNQVSAESFNTGATETVPEENFMEAYSSSSSDSNSSQDDDDDDTVELSDDSESDSEIPVLADKGEKRFKESDEKCMAVLAYITKYHLSGSACDDLMRLMNVLDVNCLKDISLFKLKTSAVTVEPVIYDICDKCSTLFPSNLAVIDCQQPGCSGKRYKGTTGEHGMRQRKSYFACLPLQSQLKDILGAPGVFTTMQQYRLSCEEKEGITDILDGGLYQELRRPGNFLSDNNNFSLIFNTDGVPLYTSSGISIWPVYLVINELPPNQRFSKKNMVLWGTWQGQGKPAFQSFFQVFVKDMVDLKLNGVEVSFCDNVQQCKGIVLCAPVDLQAKAMLVEMVPHNGEFGCLTCEEPGEVVRQGKGHARVYPFRRNKPDSRTSAGILQNGAKALEEKKNVKGIKSISTLHGMEWFDVVIGLPPDYMHGILLGVTKTLLKLHVSSRYSSQPFSIGKFIKEIDKRLTNMKPTDQIPRMPRKLEKHLHHFKANELQMWLLYYSIPSLLEYLQPPYLDHFALLVEGIYILLSDVIDEEKLVRADMVLTSFYQQFEVLYGKNNCTLNIHNVSHLTQYVKQLGPLWAYSCFPFEDMNGTLIKLVHGTGDVCVQILWSIQTLKRLSHDTQYISDPHLQGYVQRLMSIGRKVKIKHEAINCKIAGAVTEFIPEMELCEKLCQLLEIPSLSGLGTCSKALRVVIGNITYFSKQYTRLSSRVGHIVLADLDNSGMGIVSVGFYLLHHDSNKCFCVGTQFNIDDEDPLVHPIVNHIIRIKETDIDMPEHLVFPVELIKEKLLYLSGNDKVTCVARLSSQHGQLS